MNIQWHGLSCFEINTKTINGEVILLVNPFDNTTGLRFPRTLNADLVAVSQETSDCNNLEAVQGKPFVISMPGEYEVKGIFVYAIHAPLAEKGGRDHRIFRFEIEGVHLAHLGALNRSLNNEELEALNNVDVLMIPVGGGRVLSAKLANEVIEQLEPRMVIPMTFAADGLKESLGSVESFCKTIGVTPKEAVNKLKITKRDLPEEDMQVVTLERV
jgi:L-ascorbate metabolism protein UlaG (beta-lactamase superfamily)